MRTGWFWLGICALLLAVPVAAEASALRVAVAANFSTTLERIAEQFRHDQGVEIQIVSGSTGRLSEQIANGAPYDIFLSADEQHTLLLEQQGVAIKDSDFTYALGRLVLWVPGKNIGKQGMDILKSKDVQHIAIAQPEHAPYGIAAKQAMESAGLETLLSPKLVYGESVEQAAQFVKNGAVEAGFIAASQTAGVPQTEVWPVPESMHKPLVQRAVLLARAENNTQARQFLIYLQGDTARSIIREAGYGLPEH